MTMRLRISCLRSKIRCEVAMAIGLLVASPTAAVAQSSTRAALELGIGASAATAAEANALGGVIRWTQRQRILSLGIELAGFRNALPCAVWCADRVDRIAEYSSYGRLGGYLRMPMAGGRGSGVRLDAFIGGGLITARWSRRTYPAWRTSNPTTGYGAFGVGIFGSHFGGSATLVGYRPIRQGVFTLAPELVASWRL
jgi:hypothetical protein